MKLKRLYLLVFLFCMFSFTIPQIAFCLPPDPIDNCTDPLDPLCPIDSGLTILLVAGIGISATRKKP